MPIRAKNEAKSIKKHSFRRKIRHPTFYHPAKGVRINNNRLK